VGDGQDARSVKLEGGIENTFDGSVYLRKNGDPTVYTAEGGVRYALSKTTYDLRDKQLFAFDEPSLQKLVVKAKANSYTLERNAEKAWMLTGPPPEPAEVLQVTSMLGALGAKKAQKFPDDTPANRTAFGLDKPQVDATLTTTDGKTIHLRMAKGGTPEAVYGLREDDSGAVLAEVPAEALNDLDRNAMDLKDRTLVRFKKEQVVKAVFHNADGTEVVVTKPTPEASADAWRVVSPQEGKAQIFKVTSALWTLGSYRAGTRVEENPKDWGKYGIGPKSRYIAVFGPDGELGRLTIGSPVKDKPVTYYARGTRPLVVELDGSRFSDFPVTALDVLDLPKPDGGVDAGP
jgi:hypothetical protein